MALLRRFTTLIRADAHGALDALEDRPTLLRQCLRDAEEALAAKKARHEALELEGRELERTARRLGPQIEELDRAVELALEKQRDDLARFAVAKLLPLRRQLDGIAARRRDLAQQREELAELIDQQCAQLDQLRVRVRAAIEHAEAAPCGADPWSPGHTVRDEEIELELLRRQGAAS